ncbi:MAG: SPOR domain-containing protein [Betaproteobacteria bacterium]|nr:SPOR domain-containing protein [Betaproteobacteria bacterium]
MQVLRTAFFLLVLGNLLLFVWGQGYFGNAGSGGEAERLSAQIDSGKVSIAGKGVPPARMAELPREACRALTGLEPDAAGKLVELLAERDAQLRINQRPLQEPKSWWLHIPPSPNGAQADKKAAELSKLGVKDFYVVREAGPNQYAISLGLYKSEESAKAYFDVLQKKKVKTARIQVREAAGDKMVVEIRGSADKLTRALADLPPEFMTATKADCAAAKP